jgi:hypothetical protein
MCFFLAPAAAALGTGLTAGAAGAAGLGATAAGVTGLTAAALPAAAAAAPAAFAFPGWMTGLTIASSLGGLYAQQQTSSAMAAANRQNFENQMQAYRFNQANNQFTRLQEAQNLATTKVANNAAARRAMSSAAVIAGEAGVTGLSVDALMSDLGARAGVDNSTAEVNYLRRDQAIAADSMNTWANTATGINKLQTPQAPDYLGAALKIGSAAQKDPRLGKYFT